MCITNIYPCLFKAKETVPELPLINHVHHNQIYNSNLHRWMLAEENLLFIFRSQLLLSLLEKFEFALGNLEYFF